MNVFVACEYSGRVRNAFRARGHNAVSCDLLESTQPGPHIQGEVLKVLDGWKEPIDILIAFPPCTYLSYATLDNLVFPDEERKRQSQDAFDFALKLFSHPKATAKAIENPQGRLNADFRAADQTINPFLFGEPIEKRTCLWLFGLPPLHPTKIVPPDREKTKAWWNKGGRKGRGQWRSKTFVGIAEAMADQWGELEKLPWLSPLGL